MVFNMFRGLSRLLSRTKSVETVAPIVGVQSAVPAVFIDRQTLIVSDGRDSIVVEWWNGSATIHTTYVDSAALKRMLRYEYLLSTVARNTSVTYATVETEIAKRGTVNGLIDCLVIDGILIRIGNTITLATGIQTF
jgi:hypothetical protein